MRAVALIHKRRLLRVAQQESCEANQVLEGVTEPEDCNRDLHFQLHIQAGLGELQRAGEHAHPSHVPLAIGSIESFLKSMLRNNLNKIAW